MKIQSSAINMASKSTLFSSNIRNNSLKTWVGSTRPNFEGQGDGQTSLMKMKLDMLDLSKQGKALQSTAVPMRQVAVADGAVTLSLSDSDKLKINALEELINALTGKRITFHYIDKIKLSKPLDSYKPLNSMPPVVIGRLQPGQRQGWGLQYESHETVIEQQKMSFSANGIVKTEDGREIDFSMQLNMSREFASHTDISIRAGDAVMKDPLVINFAGTAPGLTSKKYSFDLDADGKQDQISFVNPGSGFLALDLNSDGLINNGLELFGPQNGNGFAELSKYDGDGNGWIDENDEIYDKLRIWTKDENGNDKLFALGQKGIGAIYLGNVSTAFDMKNSLNETQGAVRSTGVFLKEDGTAGTIQHIDLAL